MKAKKLFTRMASACATAAGRPAAFLIAASIVIIWGITGPIFKFSDTWQLVINTGTTIVTFLMVFLIQNAQNRDTKALQIKIDEILFSIKDAHNALLDLEELDDDELESRRKKYCEVAEEARKTFGGGGADKEGDRPKPKRKRKPAS